MPSVTCTPGAGLSCFLQLIICTIPRHGVYAPLRYSLTLLSLITFVTSVVLYTQGWEACNQVHQRPYYNSHCCILYHATRCPKSSAGVESACFWIRILQEASSAGITRAYLSKHLSSAVNGNSVVNHSQHLSGDSCGPGKMRHYNFSRDRTGLA